MMPTPATAVPGPQAPTAWSAPAYPPVGYAPAPGYPPGYMPYQRPVRKPGVSPVLIGVLLVPVVVFVLIVIVKVFAAIGAAQPVVNPYNPPSTGSTPTSTTGSTPKSPTSPTQTQQPGTYKNDDYTVPEPDLYPPELPMPQTYDQATLWTQSNVFYNQSVPAPVRCEIPDIDPSKASDADLQDYLNTSVECLMRVWAPELQAAGFNAARPSVTIYSGTPQTPCGKMPRENALYCSADQQIYFATDLPDLFPKQKADPFAPFAVLAHEFGHAIQAQTGILYGEAAWQQRYLDEDDQASANTVSRRTEMQADCFAGEFLRSVSQSAGISDQEIVTIKAIFNGIGDDRGQGGNVPEGDHGKGKNRQAWLTIGLTSTKAGACNTFDPKVTNSQIQ